MPQPPHGWTQEVSNTLRALARDAIRRAEAIPETWVNPTPLNSKVRYLAYMDTYELYEADPEAYQGETGRGRTIKWDRSTAAEQLLTYWFRELCSDKGNNFKRNIEFVKLLTRNN